MYNIIIIMNVFSHKSFWCIDDDDSNIGYIIGQVFGGIMVILVPIVAGVVIMIIRKNFCKINSMESK